MLTDNRVLLKQLNELTYNRIVAFEKDTAPSKIIVEASRNGSDTLAVIKDGKPLYVNSKYDPQKEATTIIEQYNELDQYEHIFLIGIGIGAHIEQLIQQFPLKKFTIYEPEIAILTNFLSRFKLMKNINQIFTSLHDISDFDSLAKDFSEATLTIIWPSYMRLYEQQIKDMQKDLVRLLQETRDSLAINVGFQQRWIVNSIFNYPKVLASSNIISKEYQNLFEDKPAIIVAAGPSLNEDLPLIKEIKEEGSAYIFAVGSAVKALLNYDIVPHALFSYDPLPENEHVLQEIRERNITDIPLVFGSSVGFETVENYPGKLVHMLTSADTLSQNLLRVPPSKVIVDSPSIAVMTLQVLKKLNMNPIILAGQNLGFLEKVRYADGINYEFIDSVLTDEEAQNGTFIKNVENEDMLTNSGYIKMKTSLESTIINFPYGRVINTTKKGASIKGADFIPLEEVREKILEENNIVQSDWVIDFDKYIDGNKKFDEIFNDYHRMQINLEKAVTLANKVKTNYEAGMYSQISADILEFNKVFKKVIESKSHQFIIKSGLKVQNEKFTDRFKTIDFEKNQKKKGEKFLNITYSYLGSVCMLTGGIFPIIYKINQQLNNVKNNESIIE